MSSGNSGGRVSHPDYSTVRSRKWRGSPASWESEWDCTRATPVPNGSMSDVATSRMAEVLHIGIVTWKRAHKLCLTTNSSSTSRNNYAQIDADLPRLS
jgi:hypothetical protein